MSTVVVVTPIVIASWPMISTAVTAAIGTLGFSVVREAQALERGRRDTCARAEIELDDSEILSEAAGTNETIVIERDGVRGIFSRDERGALRLCMEGHGRSKAELRSMGEQIIGRVTQQYVYDRVVRELKERQMTIVEEEVLEDRSVRIRVRNW